jgi:hypothetical protein
MPSSKPNGIYKDMSREEYDAQTDRENWSLISEMEVSALQYSFRKKNPRERTKALDRGNAGHLAIYEPARFAAEVAVWKGGNKTKAKKAWEEFQETHAGQLILTEEEHAEVIGMRDAVRAHPKVAPHLADGAPEVSVLWTHQGDGFEMDCKSRLDWVAPSTGAILDLKTTARGVGQREFGRSAAEHGWYGQGAMYAAGFEAATGIALPYFLIAVEAEAPFDVCVYRLNGLELELGRSRYRSYLARIAECRKTGRWPGQGEEVQDLILPTWAMEGAA